MTPQQILGLSVRLFAIWLALQGAPYLFEAGSEGSSSMEYGSLVAYLLGGLYEATALLLWWFPLTIARKLLPPTQGGETLTSSPSQLTQVALVVTGIAIVALRGPTLLWYFVRWFLIRVNDHGLGDAPVEVTAQVLVTLVEVILGVVLVVSPSFIARWISPERRR